MIEFCASTKSDAIELFREWCVTDEKQKRPYRICDIKVVYNKEDHAEYGKAYRTPEEYLVYSMLPE